MTAKSRFQALTMQVPLTQKTASTEVAAMIDPLCRAICSAHDQWRQTAFFKNIQINAGMATGGTVEGPNLRGLILVAAPTTGAQGWASRYSSAVAGGIGEAWAEFQGTLRVPSLPWYPSFAAVPGPVAPPTPNVPTSLSALNYDRGRLSAFLLKERMARMLGTPGPLSGQLFEAIATGFDTAVGIWITSQVVVNVLGKGPVPTFAPPYVPVGPVVGGDNLPAPGNFP